MNKKGVVSGKGWVVAIVATKQHEVKSFVKSVYILTDSAGDACAKYLDY